MQYGEEPLSKTFYCCPIKLNKGKSIWLECWFYCVFSLELSFYNGSVDFQVGQKATGKVLVIVSFLAGCQSRKRLRLIDARPPREQALILARSCKLPGFSMFEMNVLSTKKQEGLVAGVC